MRIMVSKMEILLLHKSFTISVNCLSISESFIPRRKNSPTELPLDKLPAAFPKPNGHSTKARIKSDMKVETKGPLETADSRAWITTAKNRKYNGWLPFQADETWTYHAIKDIRLCPICEEYDEIGEFNGLDFPINWPDNIPLDPSDILKRQRWAETHITNPWLKGQCRCTIRWEYPVQTLTERLHQEVEEVA